jgi:hypothetical protein
MATDVAVTMLAATRTAKIVTNIRMGIRTLIQLVVIITATNMLTATTILTTTPSTKRRTERAPASAIVIHKSLRLVVLTITTIARFAGIFPSVRSILRRALISP